MLRHIGGNVIFSYGKPSWEQTIRLIKIWNYKHPDKEPEELTEENIKISQLVYEYENWPVTLEQYEGVEL